MTPAGAGAATSPPAPLVALDGILLYTYSVRVWTPSIQKLPCTYGITVTVGVVYSDGSIDQIVIVTSNLVASSRGAQVPIVSPVWMLMMSPESIYSPLPVSQVSTGSVGISPNSLASVTTKSSCEITSSTVMVQISRRES